MEKDDLYQYIWASKIFTQWHWFRFHFEQRLHGIDHPFAESFVKTCLECDEIIPGFAVKTVDNIASISGIEMNEPHYEQLLQKLAELHVLHQLIAFKWPYEASYQLEPTSGDDKKNPEIEIHTPSKIFGIEVKAPSLFSYMRIRAQNRLQYISRVTPRSAIDALRNDGMSITLPRDNPVKDFVISANGKFTSFKESNSNYIGLLVIVWDDYINEPISALQTHGSGLFTDQSFHKDKDGRPVKYPYLDGVVIIRHLHQLLHATRDEPLIDGCLHAFDYGKSVEFPYKAYLPNPDGEIVPGDLLERLQAMPISLEMGAEYNPMDLVFWT